MFRKYRTPYHLLLPMLALATVSGCSQPVEPGPVNQVSIAGPKVGLPNRSYTFTASGKIDLQAMIYYKWTIDDSTFISQKTWDTSMSISLKFQTLGQHLIRTTIFRTGDNTELCSAIDTFTVVPEMISISPDTLQAQVFTPCSFTAHLSPYAFPSSYQLIWLFDSIPIQRSNTDTISYSFPTIGRHIVSVSYLDSATRAVIKTIGVVNISNIPLQLSASPASALAFVPVTFTVIHSSLFPSGSRLTWDFGDGVSIDTTALAVTHSFQFTGNFNIKVSLHEGSNIIGADSTIVQISPILNGFSPALLSTFQRVSAVFFGKVDGSFQPFSISTDTLTWNGMLFHHSIYNSWSGADSQKEIYWTKTIDSNLTGGFLNGGQMLDPISASSGYSETATGNGGLHAIASESISGHLLALIWFTPDSAQFGIVGRNLSPQIGFTGGSGAPGYETMHSVDWTSPASLTVTFYKK